VLGKSWRGGPCIYWTSSPCRRSTDSATTAVSSARRHLECPETSRRCSRNVSFYTRANLFGPPAHNGGPTETTCIGAIPYNTTATLNDKVVKLCPTTDQRGMPSFSGQRCIAGAVQP